MPHTGSAPSLLSWASPRRTVCTQTELGTHTRNTQQHCCSPRPPERTSGNEGILSLELCLAPGRGFRVYQQHLQHNLTLCTMCFSYSKGAAPFAFWSKGYYLQIWHFQLTPHMKSMQPSNLSAWCMPREVSSMTVWGFTLGVLHQGWNDTYPAIIAWPGPP